MVILIKMKDGTNKKAFFRNQVFHELNAINKKEGSIQSSLIASVYWPTKEAKNGIVDMPVKQWINLSDESGNFGQDLA